MFFITVSMKHTYTHIYTYTYMHTVCACMYKHKQFLAELNYSHLLVEGINM